MIVIYLKHSGILRQFFHLISTTASTLTPATFAAPTPDAAQGRSPSLPRTGATPSATRASRSPYRRSSWIFYLHRSYLSSVLISSLSSINTIWYSSIRTIHNLRLEEEQNLRKRRINILLYSICQSIYIRNILYTRNTNKILSLLLGILYQLTLQYQPFRNLRILYQHISIIMILLYQYQSDYTLLILFYSYTLLILFYSYIRNILDSFYFYP